MAKIGKKAPKWSATVYHNGERSELSGLELRGQWYLIYWWPFDFTGICGSEVLAFQSLESKFEEAGIALIGASCNTFHAHKQWFENTEDFNEQTRPSHPIIADNNHKITRAFGVFNKELGCAFRATVLVDPEGRVQSLTCNHLGVARDPNDALVTALAFADGGGCPVAKRGDYLA